MYLTFYDEEQEKQKLVRKEKKKSMYIISLALMLIQVVSELLHLEKDLFDMIV